MLFKSSSIANAIVTILILIDGFLQFKFTFRINCLKMSHNPYFNRWFSAMRNLLSIWYTMVQGHNPYFNRWFSAIVQPTF